MDAMEHGRQGRSIMRHRLVMNFRGEAEGVPPIRVLEAILAGPPG